MFKDILKENRAFAWVLGACSAVALLPIWAVQYPPFVDYPNLLARTYVLRHLHDSGFQLARYYGAHWAPYPYLALDVTVVSLQYLFTPAMAGRIFLSVCALAIPLACWWFLKEANSGQQPLALVSLLLVYNVFFLFGFLNFQLSVGLCLVVLTLWLRFVERPVLFRWVLMLASIQLLYFTHLMGFGMALLIVSFYALFSRRLFSRSMIATWVCFIPGFILYWLSRRGAPASQFTTEFHFSLKDKLLALTAVLRGYSTPVDVASYLLLAIGLVVCLWNNRELRIKRAWVATAAAILALYWIFPTGYSAGADADKRLLPFVLLVGLAGVEFGRRTRVAVAVALLVFSLRLVNVMQTFVAVQPQLQELAASFAAAPRGARVLPIINGPDERHVNRSYLHYWAYGTIQSDWFTPYLFAGEGVQVFQMRYRPYAPREFYEYEYPRPLDWERVRADYDYVWVYNLPRFSPDLQRIGHLVYRTPHLELYRIAPHSEPACGKTAHVDCANDTTKREPEA